jgi:hypothetical protein
MTLSLSRVLDFRTKIELPEIGLACHVKKFKTTTGACLLRGKCDIRLSAVIPQLLEVTYSTAVMGFR